MKKLLALTLLLLSATPLHVKAALVQLPPVIVRENVEELFSATSAMERALAAHFDLTEGRTSDEKKREMRYRAIVADTTRPEAEKRQALYEVLEEVKSSLASPRQGDLALVGPEDAPRFLDDGDPSRLKAALDKAIASVKRRTAALLPFGGRTVRREDLLATLEDFRGLLNWNLTPRQLDGVIRARYDVYRSPGQYGTGGVLYTAYNDPVFEGSLTKSAVYRYPLYRKPSAPARFDRAQIQHGALAGKGLELVWLKHPAEAYLFELEGSGLVKLPDGGLFRLTYDGDNGRKFQGLGAQVERQGLLQPAEQARAQGQMLYLNAPHKALAELARNPRVIFFEGRRLAAGQPEVDLVKGRSVAVDTAYFPRDGLGFMTLDRPEFSGNAKPTSYRSVSRFSLAHDTGNAIRGPGRIDIYWGHDNMAQWAANHVRQPGSLYCLLLKGTSLNHQIIVQKDPPRAKPLVARVTQVAYARLAKVGSGRRPGPVRAPSSRARTRVESRRRPKRS